MKKLILQADAKRQALATARRAHLQADAKRQALATARRALLFTLAFLLLSCETASKETAGACDAPESTYPALTYHTWNNLTYALPWCYTAAEILDKTGSATVLRLDHGEGELSLDITVMEGQGDPSSMWGPSEAQYGEYYYYDFLIDEQTSEFLRFENGTKISVVTQNPAPDSVKQNLYDILSSLSLSRPEESAKQ